MAEQRRKQWAWDVVRLGYRPGYDGIRAVGLFGVLATHGGTRFRGGGVDVFFVLSGFLITSLLLEEWNLTGRLDLRAFYGRRARRLLPALFTMLVFAGVLYATVPGVNRGWSFWPTAASIVFYAGNWVIAWVGTGVHNPLGPLNHTWSLAVEEQFYILWPLVVVFCLGRRWSPSRLLVLIGGIAVASAAWRATLFLTDFTHPSHFGTFHRSDTRADGLAIGCALAVFAATEGGRALLRRFTAPLLVAVAGLAYWLWVDAASNFLDARMYLWGWFVLNIAGAVVIAHVLVSDASPVVRALSWRPLIWIGRRSYGAYLYHLPLFALVRVADPPIGFWPTLALKVSLTFAAAGLSFRYIETYFLRGKRYPSKLQSREPVETAPVSEKSAEPSPVAIPERAAPPAS